MCDQLLPCTAWAERMISSSSGVHGVLRMQGFKWLCHLQHTTRGSGLTQAGLKDIKTSITTLQTQEAGVWLLLSQYRSMLDSALADGIISREEKQKCLTLISDSDAKQSFFCSIAVLSIHAKM